MVAEQDGTDMRDEAWEKIQPALPELKRKAATYLYACAERGSTDEEGWMALDLKKDSYAPARNALVKDGLVRKSGRYRMTTSDRRANVWLHRDFAYAAEPGYRPGDDQPDAQQPTVQRSFTPAGRGYSLQEIINGIAHHRGYAFKTRQRSALQAAEDWVAGKDK